MFLFIDTSVELQLVLLNSDFRIQDSLIEKNKASHQFHFIIHDFLSKHDKKLKELEGIIALAGPGSYTGMRLSDGFSTLCKWQGMKVYSFFHYDVPVILNQTEGVYLTDAFKGEFFLKSINSPNSKIIPYDQIDFALQDEGVIWYSSVQRLDLIKNQKILKNINQELMNHSEKIFSYIVNNKIEKKMEYFRLAEAEFKVSQS